MNYHFKDFIDRGGYIELRENAGNKTDKVIQMEYAADEWYDHWPPQAKIDMALALFRKKVQNVSTS